MYIFKKGNGKQAAIKIIYDILKLYFNLNLKRYFISYL